MARVSKSAQVKTKQPLRRSSRLKTIKGTSDVVKPLRKQNSKHGAKAQSRPAQTRIVKKGPLSSTIVKIKGSKIAQLSLELASGSKCPHSPEQAPNTDIATYLPTPLSPSNKRQRTSQDTSPLAKTPFLEAKDSRPMCMGLPKVWAESRPALCETCPYYQSWQSAAYASDGLVSAMLLDKDSSGRGWMDDEIVITRAGGCMAEGEDGTQKQVKDHDENHATIKSFHKNMVEQIPLHLIIGNKNGYCPTIIPHRYAVLALFLPVEIWREKMDGKAAIFYRMQKTDLSSKSWWAPINCKEKTEVRDFGPKALRQTCTKCGQECPQRFAVGWMCANQQCKQFWKISNKIVREGIAYNPLWLEERADLSKVESPFMTKGQLLSNFEKENGAINYSETAMRGIICPKCGGCIPRMHWNGWKCTSPGCGFVETLTPKPLHAVEVIDNVGKRFDGPALSEDTVLDPAIPVSRKRHGLYNVTKYDLADGCFVTHVHSNKILNQAANGADQLFFALQKADVDFKRNLMRSSLVPGQMAKHFTCNFGFPYKYSVQSDSTSFSDAPSPILEGIRRMRWAAKQYVDQHSFKEFNELLAVAYLTKNKMGYHDDGEDTLGPTVASFSLGSTSNFKFRLKKKYLSGFTKKDNSEYDPKIPVLSCSYMADERKQINAVANTMNKAELNEHARKVLIPKDQKKEAQQKTKTPNSEPPVLLDLKLRHGDIVVMHGSDIQKYFEHESNPLGKLRFALTCRHVDPTKVDGDYSGQGKLPEAFLDPDKEYDGDLTLYQEWKQHQAADGEA